LEGLKYGAGKYIYVALNVVEATIISTSSRIGLKAIGNCVGLKRRALRKNFHWRQLLDAKEKGKRWVKGGRRV
jgi:hypothetical protein